MIPDTHEESAGGEHARMEEEGGEEGGEKL